MKHNITIMLTSLKVYYLRNASYKSYHVLNQVLAGIGLKNVSVMKLKSIKIYAFGFCEFKLYLFTLESAYFSSMNGFLL
jgi:hypothetical protein